MQVIDVAKFIGALVIALGFIPTEIAVAQSAIQSAPAFNAERLGSLPRDQWITNGGTLDNQRYSPLTQINRNNVADLRGKWRTSMGLGASSGSNLFNNSIVALDIASGEYRFVGRSDGRLTALSTTTGEMLWEFMTDAGVNSTVTTFEHDGEQYVVVHSGGGVLANGARGDGIWMFSLTGSIEPVAPGQGPGILGGGANLLAGLTVETTVSVTATGRNNMPAFGEAYTIDELYDVALFVVENLAQDNLNLAPSVLAGTI